MKLTEQFLIDATGEAILDVQGLLRGTPGPDGRGTMVINRRLSPPWDISASPAVRVDWGGGTSTGVTVSSATQSG